MFVMRVIVLVFLSDIYHSLLWESLYSGSKITGRKGLRSNKGVDWCWMVNRFAVEERIRGRMNMIIIVQAFSDDLHIIYHI